MKEFFKKIFSSLLIVSLVVTSIIVFKSSEINALSYNVKTTGLNRHFNPTKAEISKRFNSLPANATPTYEVRPNYGTGANAGKLTTTTQNNALTYSNYYRYIAGVNPVTLNESRASDAQAAAFVLSYIRLLTHNPEADAKSLLDATNLTTSIRTQGNRGAQNSNIAAYYGMSPTLNDIQDHYMNDSDAYNRNVVGHRTHLISPGKTSFGYGYAYNPNIGVRSATYVDTMIDSNTVRDTVVVWPSTYQPIEQFKKLGTANPVFSIQFGFYPYGSSQFNLINASISLKRLNDGVNIPIVFKNIDNGISSVITFDPAANHVYKAGEVYEVTVTGVTKGGVNYPINYTVEFFEANAYRELTSISFTRLPSKLNYIKGEPLDLSGHMMKLTYSDTTTSTREVPLSVISGYNPNPANYGPQRVTVGFEGLTTQLTVYTNRFKDVIYGHWAYDLIDSLASQNIVSGFVDSTFRPNANLTRAEAAKMIVGALGLNITGSTSNFSDVPRTNWAYSYISTAYTAGIITGYQDGSFKPNGQISRAEIAVMLQRAFEITQGSQVRTFSDVPTTSWAYTSVNNLSSNGIINGYQDGTFKLNNLVTRAEFAKMLKLSMDY